MGFMGAERSSGTSGQLVTRLTAALAVGTREAFAALLTEDVRWGGEQRGGGHECTTREQASDHYAGLLANGITLSIADIENTGPSIDGNSITVRMKVTAPNSDDVPSEMRVRVTIRDGLIADICIMDEPASVEVLYFEGCPNYEVFLPHLYELLDENDITAVVTLSRIDNAEQAEARQFLGSPTVRVDGRDVDATLSQLPHVDDNPSRYGMQCRLYYTADGSTGVPCDQWILDALIDDPSHTAV